MPAQIETQHPTRASQKVAKRKASSSSTGTTTVNAAYGAKDTRKVARISATPASTPASTAPAPRGTGSGRSASKKKRRSSPEPTLTRYKPPKPISDRVKHELDRLDKHHAARQKILVAPHLTEGIKVTKTKTLISPKTAKHVASQLPKAKAKQTAQKVRPQKAKPGQKVRRENPKIQGRKEKRVAHKLEKAAKKTQGGLAKKLNRGFGPNETIKQHQAALVAEAEGLPGKTYGQIAKGESGLRPGVPNPDDATPSLFQMTPSVQSAATVKKWDKIAAKYPGGYTNPIVAAKQAKVLAGGGTGVSNYFGTAFVTDPDAHLPGGPAKAREKLYGERKPIPKAAKSQAKEVLGKRAAKKVIAKAKQPPTTAGGQPLKGMNSGSKTVVQKLVGSHVHGDWGTKNEGTIHTPTGDHYDPHSYAQDINSPTGKPSEGEPPYNQATLNKIVRNARKFGFKDIPSLKIGQNYEGTAKGYRLQLLTNEGGTVNHIHVGVRYEGAGASVASSGYSTSGTASTAVSGPYTASKSTSSTDKRKKRHKKHRKAPRVSLIPLPAELDISKYKITPSTESYADYVKGQTSTKLGL